MLAVTLVLVGVLRIASTWEVFSETYDEGVHIAAGIELLDRGTFTWEPKHPPLARTAVALGPWLAGSRFQGMPDIWSEGRAIIHAQDADRTLLLARLGTLPFFLLGAAILWMWARQLAGELAALAAVGLYSTAPLVLAHSSVATTDMAMAATFVALLFATSRWVEAPTQASSVWLGLAGAATVTAKLSSVAFFGVTLLLMAVIRAWLARDGDRGPRWLTWDHMRGLPTVLAVAVGAAWVVYHFQTGNWHGVPVPLTTLAQGFRDMLSHNGNGHASYLLGEVYADGRLMFFPVGLLVKSPLTWLSAGLAGVLLVANRSRVERDWRLALPLLAAAAVMALSVVARINIGTRHVLAVVVLLSLCGGIALMERWRRLSSPAGRAILVAACAAGMWSTVRVHPDYLAYFNELAGAHPERVLVDSDLDWGQDLRRLRDTLQARQVDSVTMAYFGSAVPEMYGIPVRARWKRDLPVRGWFVVSTTLRQRGPAALRNGQWELHPDALAWLNDYTPVATIGRSLALYEIR